MSCTDTQSKQMWILLVESFPMVVSESSQPLQFFGNYQSKRKFETLHFQPLLSKKRDTFRIKNNLFHVRNHQNLTRYSKLNFLSSFDRCATCLCFSWHHPHFPPQLCPSKITDEITKGLKSRTNLQLMRKYTILDRTQHLQFFGRSNIQIQFLVEIKELLKYFFKNGRKNFSCI